MVRVANGQVIEWLGVLGWLRRAGASEDEKSLGTDTDMDPFGEAEP